MKFTHAFKSGEIIQAIKLDSEPQRLPEQDPADLTLKKGLEIFFDQTARMRNGVVDIEVPRHSRFRPALERHSEELS
jgi:hypothetical protein